MRWDEREGDESALEIEIRTLLSRHFLIVE